MSLEPNILVAALETLEARRTKVLEQIQTVRQLLNKVKQDTVAGGGSIVGTRSPLGKKPRKPLSEESLARIRAAQKKRWAAFRKAKKAE